jgi:Uma2 family endonuclease
VLIVEVLSPSTRRFDLGYKLKAYAMNGASWYWVIDPEAAALTMYRNEGGRFAEVQRLTTPGETVGPLVVRFDPVAACR